MLSFPRRSPRNIAIFSALVLAVALGCATKRIAQNPTTGRVQVLNSYNQYSPQDEVQVGREAAAEAMKQLPLLPLHDPRFEGVLLHEHGD